MAKYYCGIGSRKTPTIILRLMAEVAQYMYKLGFTLRSGGAEGADTAFGLEINDRKEIFYASDADGDINAYNLLRGVCKELQEQPNIDTMRPYIRNLLARNMYQILGKDLRTPVKCVICWTPGGRLVGGTRYAIKLAQMKDIVVYNLAIQEDYDKVVRKVRSGS